MTRTIDSNGQPVLLLAECDLNIGFFVSEYLNTHGFQCVWVEDCPDALDLLPNLLPDMVLTNYTLPSMTGLEMFQKMKAQPETAKIPLIFVAAASQTDTIVAALKMGAQDYVVLPYEVREVAARIERILTRLQALKS